MSLSRAFYLLVIIPVVYLGTLWLTWKFFDWFYGVGN